MKNWLTKKNNWLAIGAAPDVSRSVFKLDAIKFYSFWFVILASMVTGILIIPPSLKHFTWRCVSQFVLWLLEWASLSLATFSTFQIYMELEERWQRKLRLYLSEENSSEVRAKGPAGLYYESFDQADLCALRKRLAMSARCFIYGVILIIVRAMLSDN